MLALLRSIVAVFVGYLVFAVPAFAVFQLLGQAPHAPAPLGVMLISTITGIVFAVAGGYLAGWIGGRRPAAHGLAMAALLAAGAAVSLASTLGHGAVWSQVAALALMAPGAALGGWWRARTSSRS
jgi:hypothetical protein